MNCRMSLIGLYFHFGTLLGIRYKHWGYNWSFIAIYCSSSKTPISVKIYMCLWTAHQDLDRARAQHFGTRENSSWVNMTAFSTADRSIVERFFSVIWAYQVFEYQNPWQGKGTWFCATEKWPSPLMPKDHCSWQQFTVHFAFAKGCHFANYLSLWLFTFSR